MKTLTPFAVVAALTTQSPVLAQVQSTEVYGIHLYFDERPYVDVLTLRRLPNGRLVGRMDVPGDFSGDVQNLVLKGRSISFDLLVPRNSSRPKDLMFHYEGHFHDLTRKQLAGFVTLKDQAAFIASFVGFLRAEAGGKLQ